MACCPWKGPSCWCTITSRASRLDRLIAEHRPLAACEVVTLLVPLAQALAAVHACGQVHGRVSPSSVLLGDDGRPMLADTGVAALLDGGDRPTSQGDDVRDLALTGRAALGPAARGGSLGAVLSAVVDGDAARRPTATAFAAAVFETGPAAPIHPVAAGSARVTLSQAGQPERQGALAATPRSHRSDLARITAARVDAGSGCWSASALQPLPRSAGWPGPESIRLPPDRAWQLARARRRTTKRPRRCDGGRCLPRWTPAERQPSPRSAPGGLPLSTRWARPRCAATAPGCPTSRPPGCTSRGCGCDPVRCAS